MSQLEHARHHGRGAASAAGVTGMSATIKPTASQYTVEDGLNQLLTICRDVDADPGVVSFILDQQGGANYMYVTLDGLRALVAAAEQLQGAA